MPLDYHKIKKWPFKTSTRSYTRADTVHYARGFGAGLPGALEADDAPFLDPVNPRALPMMGVPLADGEFWQRDPAAGLQWRQIVHAQETITVHRALESHGTVIIERSVVDIYDRGADKGALLHERQVLCDVGGEPVITIDVHTVLRGDGGFGGRAAQAPRPPPVPADRPPEAVLDLRTPSREEPVFGLPRELAVSDATSGLQPGQLVLRGVCCFGLAGRAVLKLVCDNDPRRLRRLSVRYAGPMLTDETMRTDLWRTGTGTASFRLRAIERNAPVLGDSCVEFTP
jgi:hypothetical protein